MNVITDTEYKKLTIPEAGMDFYQIDQQYDVMVCWLLFFSLESCLFTHLGCYKTCFGQCGAF